MTPKREATIIDYLVEAIGQKATDDLIDYQSGKRLYVPIEFSVSHQLCQILGEEAFKKLVENFAGDTLTFPLGGNAVFEKLRKRAIEMHIKDGISQENIAAALGVSRRSVQRWLAQQPADPRQQQFNF